MLPSDRVLYYFDQTPYAGYLDPRDPDVITSKKMSTDTMQIQLRVTATIEQACFKAYGSCATIACASYLCEQLMNKTKEAAAMIRFNQLIDGLELTPQERYAAVLADDVLTEALAQWNTHKGINNASTNEDRR